MAEELGIDPDELDPSPNIHALFQHYNKLYFGNALGACSVQWSSGRMTLCAGVCEYRRGGGCTIKLSEPLLKYRPPRDLKDTLLHEMIHAQLFLAGVRDDGDHGPRFRAAMDAINAATMPDPQRPAGGYRITVYHSLHDEVAQYRTHVWVCSRCGHTIARASNRRPQPADCRRHVKPPEVCGDPLCTYHMHVAHCGGDYTKVSEPDPKPKEGSKKRSSATSSSSQGAMPTTSGGSSKRAKGGGAGTHSIRDFFTPQQLQQQQQGQQEQQGQPPPQPPAAALQPPGAPQSRPPPGQPLGQPPPPALSAAAAAAAAAIARAERMAVDQDARLQQQQQLGHTPGLGAATGTPGVPPEVVDLLEDSDVEEGMPPGALQHQQDRVQPRCAMWQCPVCAQELAAEDLGAVNAHLDTCLALVAG